MTIRNLSVLLLAVVSCSACADRTNRAVRDSIVRIDTESGSGTGFFVAAPDQHRYVVTAAHVVSGGGKITVSRQVDIGSFDHYVEAYPEADIVAFDAESDVALLQLRNIPAEKMPPLALAEPVSDEEIASYGFPASSLVGRLGLTRKDGKLSNMVQLPCVDPLTHHVLKQHAVKAVIVSSALEPGFSGGPTLNARGEVVGVNVQKDDTHQAQNAAVHPAALTALFKQVKPRSAPTTQEVTAFLSTIQAQYLQLPIRERLETSETAYVSLEEVPKLRALAQRVVEQPKPAQFLFSQVPGQTLPTVTSGEVMEAMTECQKRTDAMKRLLKDTGIEQSGGCASVAMRPLAWDLIAASLQWTERPHGFSVVKVDEVDPVARQYNAMVKSSDDDSLSWTVHLVSEGSTLKLRLFDGGVPYALSLASRYRASDLTGQWTSVHANDNYSEKLEVIVDADDSTVVRHYVHNEWSAPEGKIWWCANARTIGYDVEQAFHGRFKGGMVQAEADPKQASRKGSACTDACNRCAYTPDVYATFKRVGDRLVMTRSDRNNVGAVEFQRQPVWNLTALAR